MGTVRVVHREGNTGWGGEEARIKPYKLKPSERVLSAKYTTGSGNYERLTLIIETTDDDPGAPDKGGSK